MDDVTNLSGGATMFYQIDPTLNPRLSSETTANDNYYNLDSDITMLQMNF